MPPARNLTSPRKQRSRQQLLATIRARGGVTRGELNAITGLSRSAIADAVQDLIAERLITEDRSAGAERPGRPSGLLLPAPAQGAVAGIDFGHSHVAVALADTTGELLAEHREILDVDQRSTLALDTAANLVTRSIADSGLNASDIVSIVAGIAGPIDSTTGAVGSTRILPSWKTLDPSRELARRLGQRVHVGNDAGMGARGELRFGAARGCQDFIYIKASHGIGAGLRLGGTFHDGASGLAGEIGHTQLTDNGEWCRCGNRGCLETIVSITQIRNQLKQIGLDVGEQDAGQSLAEIAQHPIAARVITQAGRTLGRVLADLCNCLNPEAIILGGELGTAGAPFADGVRESIGRYAQHATAQAVTVHTAQLGLRAELMGAIAAAIQYSHQLP